RHWTTSRRSGSLSCDSIASTVERQIFSIAPAREFSTGGEGRKAAGESRSYRTCTQALHSAIHRLLGRSYSLLTGKKRCPAGGGAQTFNPFRKAEQEESVARNVSAPCMHQRTSRRARRRPLLTTAAAPDSGHA